MATRRRRTYRRRSPMRRRTRTVYRTARRTYRRSGLNLRSLLKAAGYGLAASIGGYMAARATGRPMLAELGQRGGAILSAKWGWRGAAAYQIADALFDRGVVQRTTGINVQSGTVNAV